MISLVITLLFSIATVQSSTIIFTIYDTSHNLKELVGSLHSHTSNLKFLVFGYPSQDLPRDEITLWRHVRFVDIQQEIKYSTNNRVSNSDDQEILKLYLFEYIFEEEMADKVVFIQSGFVFDKSVLKIENGLGTGFQVYTKTGGYEEKLDIFRGLKDKITKEDRVYNLNLPRVSNDSKWSCSIKIRNELIFSGLLDNKDINRLENSNIALLVPVKNENDKIEDCALLKYLIPSIMNTTDHVELNSLTIYVGYDVDDPLFKDQSKRELVRRASGIAIQFFELPKTGWLTFIWNFLFVQAYEDGSDYFIQLNDDVKFLKSGWLKGSTSILPVENKGVIGFNDAMWQCKLYTQTLVNRNHYKTFKGHYFPLSLRNWYSDDWITAVYKDQGGACNRDAMISNSNVGRRYEPCDSRNLEQELREGIIKVKMG